MSRRSVDMFIRFIARPFYLVARLVNSVRVVPRARRRPAMNGSGAVWR